MIPTKFKSAGAVLLAVGLIVSSVGLALSAAADDGQQNQNDDGQQNQNDDGRKNQAVVKVVDPGKSTLKVSVARQGKQVDQTFILAKDVPVVVSGKAAKLGDLKPGMLVGLTLSKDKKVVVGIKQVQAKLKNKNANQNQNDDGQKNQNDDGEQHKGNGTE